MFKIEAAIDLARVDVRYAHFLSRLPRSTPVLKVIIYHEVENHEAML